MTVRERFPRRAGVATLVAREVLTPRMIRVTLRCDAFRDEWPIEQPGEIITLLFVPPDEPIVLPQQDWTFPPDAQPQEWRNYTVRRHRAELGEIDVDVVLHEPRGPACIGRRRGRRSARASATPGRAWTSRPARTSTGCCCAATRPRCPRSPRSSRAAGAAGARRRRGARRGRGDAVDYPRRGSAWVHRDGAPAATTAHLADALRELALPDGAGQAWGAAESRIARDLRTVLRDERGMPKSHAHRARLLATQRRLVSTTRSDRRHAGLRSSQIEHNVVVRP